MRLAGMNAQLCFKIGRSPVYNKTGVGTMCGRYALYAPPQRLADLFAVENIFNFPPRYNAAPGQYLPVIVHNRMGAARWGFPGKTPQINARSETIVQKSLFSESWSRRRRCLIPASGFYEWRKDAASGSQPFFIHDPSHEVIAFAGLWMRRQESIFFTILTKNATDPLASIHERMPIILYPEQARSWFAADDAGAQALIAQATGAGLVFHAVDRRVGNVINDDAALITPLTSSYSSTGAAAIPARSAS
jgi:putative SOS response-associated peptidase YedK